jgi:hypothetical protein
MLAVTDQPLTYSVKAFDLRELVRLLSLARAGFSLLVSSSLVFFIIRTTQKVFQRLAWQTDRITESVHTLAITAAPNSTSLSRVLSVTNFCIGLLREDLPVGRVVLTIRKKPRPFRFLRICSRFRVDSSDLQDDVKCSCRKESAQDAGFPDTVLGSRRAQLLFLSMPQKGQSHAKGSQR